MLLAISLRAPLLVAFQYSGKSDMIIVLSVLTNSIVTGSFAFAGGKCVSALNLFLQFSSASCDVQVARAKVFGV